MDGTGFIGPEGCKNVIAGDFGVKYSKSCWLGAETSNGCAKSLQLVAFSRARPALG